MALSDFLVATEDAMECIDEGGFIEQHRVAYLIGVQAILGMSETSEGDKEIAAHRQSLLAGHLHTELLNRIDEAVIFHQLRKKDLGDVAAHSHDRPEPASVAEQRRGTPISDLE